MDYGTDDIIEALPEQPGQKREARIKELVQADHYVLDWWPIDTSACNRRLRFWVSSDVLRLGCKDDSVRVAVTCRTHQQLADRLGAMMPTTVISDLIWANARNVLGIHTQTPDSRMAYTSRFVQHSKLLDYDLGEHDGLCTAGKDFVLTSLNRSRPQRAANYGWHQINGLPIQPLGTAHSLDFTDYSQFCRLVKREADLDGRPIDLADVIVAPDLAPLISADGPLPWHRHPGVPRETNDISGPTSAPWRADVLSIGERALLWSQSELEAGVCENPPGSNTSPRIASYFAPATRNIAGVERMLNLKGGHWCAVAACAAMKAVLLPGEVAPHPYRCSGYELQQDAAKVGTWRPKSALKDWRPAPGDLCILDRGGGWKRHVCRVVNVAGEMFVTIGGNESDRWSYTDRRFDNSELLGFVEYPRVEEEEICTGPETAARLYELSRSVWMGEGENISAILHELDEQEKFS